MPLEKEGFFIILYFDQKQNMSKSKIFNDPVYGFVTIPYGILFDLVEHPYFQRLRRISQLGLTSYVYPGALHTRFHHALGALHLTREAVKVLRDKGVEISDEEAEGVAIAILLHDIGHGPFSHALEHTLVNLHHEELSLLFMEDLNKEFNGALEIGIKIFTDQYPKHFLHQLVSSQLDMDRLDYLNRDSFFTGVSEGVIGYDRIIKMLNVANDELVVEEKGIYSVEKFLISRRIMYWQVYLHKTSLGTEQLLINTLLRAKEIYNRGERFAVSEHLAYFMAEDVPTKTEKDKAILRQHFAQLDDIDLLSGIKRFAKSKDQILAFLANSLLNRKLFRVEVKKEPFEGDYLKNIRQIIVSKFNLENRPDETKFLIYYGTESNNAYNALKDEIKILSKDGSVKALSTLSEHNLSSGIIKKYFLCYPKNLI